MGVFPELIVFRFKPGSLPHPRGGVSLMFFNLDGVVLWGNHLALEVREAWETRRSLVWGGSIRSVDREEARAWLEGHFTGPKAPPSPVKASAVRVKTDTKTGQKMEQLSLF